MYLNYEHHNYIDPQLPISFHLDKQSNRSFPFPRHWHEHIELLYVKKGTCMVQGNGVEVTAGEGEIIMITPNCIHYIYTSDDVCMYYCITVDKSFCDKSGIPISSGHFAMNIPDEYAKVCYKNIIEIMLNKPRYYKEEVKALVVQLMIRCCRSAENIQMFADTKEITSQLVVKAIDYIYAHFNEPITVNELCTYLGFSKYYVCRKFKAQTGKTIIDYVNYLRCMNAKRLIESGKVNITESARLSGFNNMSYFTRTYRRHMGDLPSKEI